MAITFSRAHEVRVLNTRTRNRNDARYEPITVCAAVLQAVIVARMIMDCIAVDSDTSEDIAQRRWFQVLDLRHPGRRQELVDDGRVGGVQRRHAPQNVALFDFGRGCSRGEVPCAPGIPPQSFAAT